MAVDTPKSAPAPPRIPLYEQSSQYRNWRYSQTQLDEIRKQLNVTAVDRVRSVIEQERAAQTTSTTPSASASADPSPSTSATDPSPPPPAPDSIEYLTIDDERSLVSYYLTQLSQMCRAFRYPEAVEATATSYMKRFYLRNTCMDYHPKSIMLTCAFLATKTENYGVSIDSFAGKLKTRPEDILSLEFLVSQSLRFEYKVHHAHLALAGVILDLQACDLSTDSISAANTAAQKLVRTSRLTDLEFIYTPAQIALACVNLADPALVSAWLAAKEGRRPAEEGVKPESGLVEKLLEVIGREVKECEVSPVQKDKVAEVDRRLKFARNPEKDPNSAMYKKRKAEEEAERDAHQQAKAAKRPPPVDDSSVFD